MEPEIDIANALKEFRREHQLEQEDLARLLGTTQQTISNWESGTKPRTAALRKISHLMSTYRESGAQPPLPPKPTFDPHVTAIHDVRLTTGLDARLAVARGLTRILERGAPQPGRDSPQREMLDHVAGRIPQSIKFATEPNIEFSGIRLRPDFLSQNVCAEIKLNNSPVPNTAALDSAMLQLTTMRKILEATGDPRKHYALILITTKPDTGAIGSSHKLAAVRRLLSFGALHDIEIFVANGYEECASLLTDLETGEFDAYDGDTG